MPAMPNNVYTALAAFRAACPPIPKNAFNPHFKSKYADLATIIEVVAEPLAAAGLVWYHTASDETVSTTVYHPESDTRVTFTLPIPTVTDPQKLGSAVTYLRRYTVAGVLGVVADDDDDGNAASSRTEAPRSATKPAPVSKPTPQPQSHPVATGGDWRGVVFHFGKNKDKTLGELDMKALGWYIENYRPREYPEGSGKFSQKDEALRAALDQALAERDAPAAPPPDDEPPF